MNCRVEVRCTNTTPESWGLAFENLDRAWENFTDARRGSGIVRVELVDVVGGNTIKYWTREAGVVCL